jgi:hypothetical protein
MEHTYLTAVLHYNPETGEFLWNLPRPKVQVGQRAGYEKKNKGYIYIEIDGKSYSAHRLAWFYMTGAEPKGHIDHINGKKTDNSFANLREATSGQNRANSKHNNKTGMKGVRCSHWIPEGKRRWMAQITHNKKVMYLGSFFTKEEAHAAYCDAAKRLHGDFFHS